MSQTRNQPPNPQRERSVTAKQWCCLYDAANGQLVGRATRAADVWSVASDGAVLHPGEVLDALVAAGLLRPVRRGRWSAAGSICLPVEVECLAPS